MTRRPRVRVRERDAASADALAFALHVWRALGETGDLPTHVAAEVVYRARGVRAERDALRLVAQAAHHERSVRTAWLATLPSCATAPDAVLSAEAATAQALDAALVGCP